MDHTLESDNPQRQIELSSRLHHGFEGLGCDGALPGDLFINFLSQKAYSKAVDLKALPLPQRYWPARIISHSLGPE